MAPLISSTTARSAAAAGVPGSASPIKAALAEMASNNDTRRRRIMSFTLGRPAQPDMGRTWPGPGPDMALTTRTFVSHFLRHHGGRERHYMKGTTVLNRREFSRFCLSAGACAMTADSSALGQPSGAAQSGARTVKLRDSRSVPALGQGSARLAHGRHPQAEEEAALRAGIDL